MMYVKLLLKDLKYTIKHNKILFSLLVIGLLFISLLSLLLCEVIRSEIISINSPQKKDGYLCYKYEEPQNADTIIDAIDSFAWDTYSLYMITSTAYNNNPFYYDIITDYTIDNAPHKFIYNSDSGAGIVGYKKSKLSIKNPIMSSGEFFSEKIYEKPVAVITKSVATQITDNNTIIAEDHTFEILGTIDSESTGNIAFTSCNILTPIETFRDLGLKASIVFIEFKAKPNTRTLNKITEALDALGKNINTAKKVSTFSWNVIFQYFLSSITYVAVLALLFAILLLTFKCWISSQQSTYAIYYICGITSPKMSFLRIAQLCIIITPVYTVAAIISVVLTVADYKKYTYSIDIGSIIINYLFIIVIICILTIIQNRKISGFKAINTI